jgi:hypothetical protein
MGLILRAPKPQHSKRAHEGQALQLPALQSPGNVIEHQVLAANGIDCVK